MDDQPDQPDGRRDERELDEQHDALDQVVGPNEATGQPYGKLPYGKTPYTLAVVANLGKADRDLVGMTVLALLTQGERHTYDMHRQIVDTHKDFVTGLPRSMYHAVERLSRDGLIAAGETTREGGRPERTLYRLTDAGRAELHARVRRLLQTPDPDATLFVAALSFVGSLSVSDTRDALEIRATTLNDSATSMRSHLGPLSERLPRLLLVELEYELARVSGELAWVRALVADLDSGALSWPADLTKLVIEGDS
ncbi:MAG TPA: helix-turn-helix transcriptional regulator [Pseudonocardiaceae bacterium]|nr:helix-turn-helix transcriptional regulator [Pseudonocardiaceae bacterium]